MLWGRDNKDKSVMEIESRNKPLIVPPCLAQTPNWRPCASRLIGSYERPITRQAGSSPCSQLWHLMKSLWTIVRLTFGGMCQDSYSTSRLPGETPDVILVVLLPLREITLHHQNYWNRILNLSKKNNLVVVSQPGPKKHVPTDCPSLSTVILRPSLLPLVSPMALHLWISGMPSRL